MKKLFLSALMVCSFVANAQTSLLPAQGNFGFEGGTPTNAYWWFLGTGSGGSANFVWQTVEKHTGNAAYQLNVVTPATQEWGIQVTSTYNESDATYPTVVNGTSYTLRFWMKTNDGGGTVRISNTGSSLWMGSQPITQGDWKLYSFTFTGNDTKYKPYIELGKSTAGTYYIDDVALYETSTLGVADLSSAKKDLSVYPNPAKNLIHLNSADAKTVNIYDTNGRHVMSSQSVNNINVSTLSKGVYIIKTDTGITSKFIKE